MISKIDKENITKTDPHKIGFLSMLYLRIYLYTKCQFFLNDKNLLPIIHVLLDLRFTS